MTMITYVYPFKHMSMRVVKVYSHSHAHIRPKKLFLILNVNNYIVSKQDVKTHLRPTNVCMFYMLECMYRHLYVRIHVFMHPWFENSNFMNFKNQRKFANFKNLKKKL